MSYSAFQTQVNLQQAPGFEGDFSSANPRFSAEAGPGSYVAGTGGLTVGRFCWEDATSTYLTNAGTGAPTGFVHREQGVGIITAFLAGGGVGINAGFMATAFKAGEFWVRNAGTGAVTKGQKVYASNTTGQAQTAATGQTISGYTETKWYADSACLAGELFKMTTVPQG